MTAPPPLPRIGFEIELLAPRGLGRRDLAELVASERGGAVSAGFHLDSEPSLVPGKPVFHHLSPAFTVVDADGSVRCRLVDDITIQDDLDRAAPARPGHWRIVSDEPRLLRLVERHADPTEPIDRLLDPVAALFGSAPQLRADGRVRLDDRTGATIAMAVPQGGERERVCELITPPIDADHDARLAELLEPARRLGFGVPAEAAVHLHLDAEPFRSAATFGPLVRSFGRLGESLRRAVGTNPRCRRLGPVDADLLALVERPGFDSLDWADVEAELAGVTLSKYRDLNLVNLQKRTEGKDTVEIRILPGSCDASGIIDMVRTLGAHLTWPS